MRGWETEGFGPATLFRLPGYVVGEPSQPVPRDLIAAMTEGGAVLAPPADTGVGRTAVVSDPAGAVFSISKVV